MSVVIPTRRGGSYLREAIGSLRVQTYARWEAIVVADGCDDPLTDIEESDSRIRVLHQPTRGASVARNVAIAESQGTYIAFLDDDDHMLPERLSRQRAALEARPDAVLCHTQFRFIDGLGQVTNPGFAADVQYEDLLRREIRVLFGTMMIRKHVLEEVGTFNAALRTGQDLDVVYRLARVGPMVFEPDVLMEYRRHRGNATADERQSGRNVEAILERHLRLAERSGQEALARAARAGIRANRLARSQSALVSGRQAWQKRDLRQTVESLADALRLAPADTTKDLLGNRRLLVAARRVGRSRDRRTQLPSA